MKAYVGLPITIFGPVLNATNIQAGIVTRVWSEKELSSEVVCINCHMFRDAVGGGEALTSIYLFDTEENARVYAARQHVPCAWPASEYARSL